MERLMLAKLERWAVDPMRKPLLLLGARQVGKTWLLTELGRTCFENTVLINLDHNSLMQAQFEAGFDLSRILLAAQAQARQPIIPGKTLLVFDEIQECPLALTSLKYFAERMPELAVAAAGSLLGITLHRGTGYPVGKVMQHTLYPLCFEEFLHATGQKHLAEIAKSDDWTLMDSLATLFEDALRQYCYIGGMPEPVQAFAADRPLDEVRQIQNMILVGYENDISKHLSLRDTERTLAAWRSIPAQLAGDTSRFVFSEIKSGTRARDYHAGITWLERAALVTRVPRISKPHQPLAAYAMEHQFKLFAVDVGLMAAMADLQAETLFAGDAMFTKFKGALTEQFVCQQLLSACGLRPYYWKEQRAEADFVVQARNGCCGIEVKASENLRSKSLRAFKSKYPSIKAVRFSLSGYREQDWMKNVPLYAIQNLSAWE